MNEDDNLSQLQDGEIKTLVGNYRSEVEQKTSELNKLQASLPPLQEQLSVKQATLNDLQSHCCHDDVVTDVRQMKNRIKEIKNEHGCVDIQLTTIVHGGMTNDLLLEISALRDKIKEKEMLLQQLNDQLSEVQQTQPLMDRHQIKLQYYKQFHSFVDKFFI